MKSNIQYNGTWWSWEETCDKCNKLIHNDKFESTEKPDAEELDLCSNCIRELMDSNILYEKAKEKYKPNKDQREKRINKKGNTQ